MSSEALERAPEQHTLEELHPAAYRCWQRIHAKLPPSDPRDHGAPSVNLDTLAAILHASLADLAAARAREQRLHDALRGLISYARAVDIQAAEIQGGFDFAAALAAEPAAERLGCRGECGEPECVEGFASAAADEPGERE